MEPTPAERATAPGHLLQRTWAHFLAAGGLTALDRSTVRPVAQAGAAYRAAAGLPTAAGAVPFVLLGAAPGVPEEELVDAFEGRGLRVCRACSTRSRLVASRACSRASSRTSSTIRPDLPPGPRSPPSTTPMTLPSRTERAARRPPGRRWTGCPRCRPPTRTGVRDAVAPSTLPDGWAGALAAVAGAPAHWRMELTVPGAGAAALEVLDAGAGGLWSLAPVDPAPLGSEQDGAPLDGEPVAVSPTSPSRSGAGSPRSPADGEDVGSPAAVVLTCA